MVEVLSAASATAFPGAAIGVSAKCYCIRLFGEVNSIKARCNKLLIQQGRSVLHEVRSHWDHAISWIKAHAGLSTTEAVGNTTADHLSSPDGLHPSAMLLGKNTTCMECTWGLSASLQALHLLLDQAIMRTRRLALSLQKSCWCGTLHRRTSWQCERSDGVFKCTDFLFYTWKLLRVFTTKARK